jgi:hypothetical protein
MAVVVQGEKHIACLGSYHEHDRVRIPLWYVGFWRHAAAHLDQLGNRLSAYDREKIEAAIARKSNVPRRSNARSPSGTMQKWWHGSDLQ